MYVLIKREMVLLLSSAILVLIATDVQLSYAQSVDFLFFSESDRSSYYEYSFGFSEGESTLLLINDGKAPVDTQRAFRGDYSIKLQWKSGSGGDWGLALASPGWPGYDISTKDTLSFWVKAENGIRDSVLPALQVEDLDNRKSEPVSLSPYVDTVRANQWNLIRVPVYIFEQNSGSADLARIKTVWFRQGVADGSSHTLFIDNVRMYEGARYFEGQPERVSNLSVRQYERHVTLTWDESPSDDVEWYRVYRSASLGDSPDHIGTVQGQTTFFTDFRGEVGSGGYYWVKALDTYNEESEPAGPMTGVTKSMSDDEFLSMVQRATFRYFWDYAHPVSGLSRERSGSGDVVAIGGSGFGVMAIIVGIHRGFISREEGRKRIVKIVKFLQQADRFHGAWPHWMDGRTGEVIPFSQKDNGGDLVETAFMMQGLLTARAFFKRDQSTENEIRSRITRLWETIEWDWYRRTEDSEVLYWHWSPEYQWDINLPVRGWNETMMVYILAISSPTHGVPGSMYEQGWADDQYVNGESYYGHRIFVGNGKGGPLFFTHYSFQGFDPREIRDSHANYFEHNRNQTLVNRAYCIDNPLNHKGYGPDTWGLTASDEPGGYGVHAPNATEDNGTVTPTAALSSMPYTPDKSLSVLKHLYRTYGNRLWGAMGFKDAFNLDKDWFADSYLAIDQGPIINMIENHRSGLLWENFMKNAEIIEGLKAAGFTGDKLTDIKDNDLARDRSSNSFQLLGNYPNPFNSRTRIRYILEKSSKVTIEVFNGLGQKVNVLLDKEIQSQGRKSVVFSPAELPSGLYYYVISIRGDSKTGKLLLMK